MKEFDKILIANRGEIALRVMRTARDMGIRTVAVYSEADRCALHVRCADEAYNIGESPASQSYLNIDKLIETALESGAQAIHPGYGFLSENSAFAQRCEKEGIVFIGPTSQNIELMGDKIAARRALQKTHAPLIPGTQDPVADVQAALTAASEVGYPVLIKAVGGGGGRGIRVVGNEQELTDGYSVASSEAQSAFGNGALYVEKFLRPVRHIEVQILADEHGNVIHLNERECSIQRRRQKLVEESPSQFIDDDLRQRICQAAVEIARSINYRGAGTVEFVADNAGGFYFLEMNTRLQVEHPITEATTGVDLVRQQILIARGEPLAIRQDQVKPRGAAMEVRIYAEDPKTGFAPSIGTVKDLGIPGGPHVRVDGCLFEGMAVSLYYDPLVAKLIAWGPDRGEVIERMKRALDDFVIGGIQTTIPLLRGLMDRPDFVAGAFDTEYLERILAEEQGWTETQTDQKKRIAILAAVVRQHERFGKRVVAPEHKANGPLKTGDPWQMTGRRNVLGRGSR